MGSTPTRKRATASSAKPLVKRLGIRENLTILVVDSPRNYFRILGQLPKGVVVVTDNSNGSYDFVHFFTKVRSELERSFPLLKSGLSPNGVLWISWPKASSGVHTDLNENRVREIGLANGMVDVKVVAVDVIWSGLKFVRRLREK
jgi:hypothetical protein